MHRPCLETQNFRLGNVAPESTNGKIWSSFAPASPPDVRQGCALPEGAKNQWGCAPGSAYGPEVLGRSPNQGRSPVALVRVIRQGRALPHIGAAKPVRMMTRFSVCLFRATFKTVSHIRRRSRCE